MDEKEVEVCLNSMKNMKLQKYENLIQLCHTPLDFEQYVQDLFRVKTTITETLQQIEPYCTNKSEIYLLQRLQEDFKTVALALELCSNILDKTIPQKKHLIQCFTFIYPDDKELIVCQNELEILENLKLFIERNPNSHVAIQAESSPKGQGGDIH